MASPYPSDPDIRSAKGAPALQDLLRLRTRHAHTPPPMKSMTGYGRGEGVHDGCKITLEVSSVNRRQSELNLSLPRDFDPLEPRIRDEINRHVARGRVTLRLTVQATRDRAAGRGRVHRSLAAAYARELGRLGRELKLAGPLTLDTLVRLPGVVEAAEPDDDAEALWPAIASALKTALAALTRMRAREGAHLARDLTARVTSMRRYTAQVRKRAPDAARRYREQLLQRLRQAGLEGLDLNDERLLKEVALFADRSDISEELTRLESHFGQFDDTLDSRQPVGRTLDFLAQEMNRELNTIGAKANDAAISRAIVHLKAELEKFREQVQNVE